MSVSRCPAQTSAFRLQMTLAFTLAPWLVATSVRNKALAFDFEKMEVYRASLNAIDKSMELVSRMPRGNGNLADQLKRAVTSISLNISEGVGEFKPQEKARFYRMALRSASESCAIAQIGNRLRIITDADYHETYQLLSDISKMLIRLIAAMQNRPN
jgi:four helix bundle protein